MIADWRGRARKMFPHGTTLKDIRLRGFFDKKHEGSQTVENEEFVYLATFPRGRYGQNIRIYIRDVMGIPCVAMGWNEERVYIMKSRISGAGI